MCITLILLFFGFCTGATCQQISLNRWDVPSYPIVVGCEAVLVGPVGGLVLVGARRMVIMLPVPHSLCQGSFGFLMRTSSWYVMTDLP
jgi:hypothetical protein